MPNPTAAIVVIGNEILSGRTQDINVQYIANQLSMVGIVLAEVRIIPDNIDIIADSILSIKSKYSYIFTTGGIGPTHDDLTVEAIAKTFNRPLEINLTASKMINDFAASSEKYLEISVKRTAYFPQNVTLIANKISGIPGFIIENVFVMAGVPEIMQ